MPKYHLIVSKIDLILPKNSIVPENYTIVPKETIMPENYLIVLKKVLLLKRHLETLIFYLFSALSFKILRY